MSPMGTTGRLGFVDTFRPPNCNLTSTVSPPLAGIVVPAMGAEVKTDSHQILLQIHVDPGGPRAAARKHFKEREDA